MSDKVALVIAGNFIDEEENADPSVLLNYLPSDLIAHCDIVEWSRQPSTYYSMAMTIAMEEMLETYADNGYRGIIVVCGSGVMEEMAYLVSLLWQKKQPVIFANLLVRGCTGVNDGLMNLRCAVRSAFKTEMEGMGVLICSNGELFEADDVTLAAPGSENSSFRSYIRGSVGKMLNDEIVILRRSRKVNFLARKPGQLPYVEIAWASMGASDRLISTLSRDNELSGLVLAAFGAGSIPPSWVLHVRNIIRRRIPVAVASRCLIGYVNSTNDYEGSFDKLMEMDALSCGGLNPFKARIKMTLALSCGMTRNGLALYLLGKNVDEDIPELYK